MRKINNRVFIRFENIYLCEWSFFLCLCICFLENTSQTKNRVKRKRKKTTSSPEIRKIVYKYLIAIT